MNPFPMKPILNRKLLCPENSIKMTICHNQRDFRGASLITKSGTDSDNNRYFCLELGMQPGEGNMVPS